MIQVIQNILIAAIQDDDLARIKDLIKNEGENIIQRAVCAPEGFIVSDCIAYTATKSVLDIFIQHFKEIIHYGDSPETTLFERAIFHHNQVVISGLLDIHPELLEQPNQHGFTPLFYSLHEENSSYEITKYLLEQGAMPNQTLVNFCAENKSSEFVLLVSRYLQSIEHATMNDDAPLVNIRLKRQPELLHATDYDGQTPLILAARYGRDNVLALLLNNYQPEINASSNDEGLTPLGWAIINKDYVLIQKLQQIGAEWPLQTLVFLQLNASNAAETGDIDFLKQLLGKHPELINSVDIKGNSPIIYAIVNGHYKIVNYLSDLGAKLNVTYKELGNSIDGLDALTIAILYKYKRIVSTLLCTIPELPNDIELHATAYDEIINLAQGYQLLSQRGILTPELIQPMLDHPRPLNLALSYCKLHDQGLDSKKNKEAVQLSPRPFTLSIMMEFLHSQPWIDRACRDKIIYKMTLLKYSFRAFNGISFEENRLIQKESHESPAVDQYYYKKALAATYREYRTFFSTINPQREIISTNKPIAHPEVRLLAIQ